MVGVISPTGLQDFVAALGAKTDEISVAGLAVVARDTGRVLMLQRLLDGKDPAGGTWEFPGGHIDPGESPIEGGIREWKEELGCPLPPGKVGGSWTSKKIYQGFVYVVDREDMVEINDDHEDRHVLNPDDPDGDGIEVAAWWDPADLPDMPALRPECKTTDWSLFRPSAIKKVAKESLESWYQNVENYQGTVGNKGHITRNAQMLLPTHLVANMPGNVDERPGEHRTRQGQDWEDFKDDIATHGIKDPLFVTVQHGQQPRLSEGNHRRDAAVELGLKHVPAFVRYYGHAEQTSDLEDQARKWWTYNPQHLPKEAAYDLLGPGKGHYFEPEEEGSDWCAVCGHHQSVTRHPPKEGLRAFVAVNHQYLFHTSPPHNRESITEKGLLPHTPFAHDVNQPDLPHGVYLDSDEKMALDTGNDYGEDVWKADVTGLKTHVDPWWEGVTHRSNTSHYVEEAIPPHRLTLHRPAPSHHHEAGLAAFVAVNSSDEVPPPMGESPIPEGHVRLFHQTSVKQAESVRQHGLTMEHARDISGPRGIWASHGTRFYGEGDEHATVEFHVPYDELRDTAGGQSPHRGQPQEDWEKSTHHTLIIPRSIKPHEISAIHLPWHNRYHYFHDNGMTDEVKKGEFDNLADMKDYGPAIDKIKREGMRHLAMNAEDEVPPRLGTAPIPEDHVRLYHHTWSRNVPSIREHGLLAEMGQGDSGKGYGNEASAGVWAASQHPEPDPQSDRHVIEFHAHPRDIDVNGPSPGSDIHKWNQGDHNVLMRGSVKPENILAIHAPWHTAYHQINNDARDREDVKNGKLDWVHNDPSMKEVSKAVHKIQSEGKKTRNTEKPQQCKWCKQPATKSMLWAEGMAYIPTCDQHEAKTRDHIEDKENDEVVAVHQIKHGAKQPYIGKGWWLTPEGKRIGVYDHYETTPGMARQMIRPHMAESGQVRVRSFNNQLNVQTSRPFTDAQRQSLLLDADKHSRMFVDVLHPDTEESIHSESGGPEDADRLLARAHRAAIPKTAGLQDFVAAFRKQADQPYAGGHTFKFVKANPREMGGSSLHELRAYPEDQPDYNSGSIRWSYKSGEIAGVDVQPQYRRQGLATELLDQARQVAATTRGVTAPRHSEQRTNEGEAWARSTGDRLPRRLNGLGEFVSVFGQPRLFDPGSLGHMHLPNPRGGHDWFHGTPHHFESFGEERPEEDDPYGGYDFETGEKFKQPHWNTHLGQHWTSLRGVAEHFAKGQYGQVGEGKGHVITARLGIQHPKDYKLESDMDKEAFEHAWDGHDPHDYHDEFCHNPAHRDDPDGEYLDDEPYHYNDEHERGDEVDRQVKQRYIDRDHQGEWLSQHPDSASIAESFKDKLRGEGHDGITYGNELEGPHGHQCAITFDDHQIHHSHRQSLGKLAAEAQGYDTYYHITDQHHFALDPEHAPADNAFAIQDRSHYRGLYVTKDPDTWRAQGYHRPYVAELHVPHELARQERWHGESFIPAEHFDKVKVNRVIPFDAHQREKWGEPGTIESYHGTHYQTNKPLKKKPGWESSDYYVQDEKEPATKDVRDFTPKEHTRHLKRLREYLHHVQGWGWNEFNEKHEHVGIGEDELDEEGMPIRRDKNGQPMTRDRYASLAMTAEDEEWRGLHQPSSGPPIHNLTEPENEHHDWTAPDDIYTHMHYYGDGEDAWDRESQSAIKAAHKDRGLPGTPLHQQLTDKYGQDYADRKNARRQNGDHLVTIYRAAPKGLTSIGTGDWVSPSGSYARQHGVHATDPHKDWPVYRAKVPAKHVRWAGDSLNEFGYYGPPVKPTLHYRGGSQAERLASNIGGSKTAAAEFSHQEPFGNFILKYRHPDEDVPRHRIVATTPTGYPVGHLTWHPETHEITGLNVDATEQRKGLARAMWDLGQKIDPKPVHSADRTKAGEAWARSVGGPRPKRKPVLDPFTKRPV
jgi:8-oxo-dGTP pyrophosphatase MutT (NUDIX family)/GNAT superfamily N-acetyltransferase